MFRRLLILAATAATGALAYLAWTRRDDLQRMAERAQGEWRSGVSGATSSDTAPRRPADTGGAPRVNGPEPGDPRARVAPHPAPAARCTATTRSGKRCTRLAEPGSDVCWQHAGP